MESKSGHSIGLLMTHLSIRCQRELDTIENETEFVMSEVIDVIRELDLMDLVRAKCDGNLHKVCQYHIFLSF